MKCYCMNCILLEFNEIINFIFYIKINIVTNINFMCHLKWQACKLKYYKLNNPFVTTFDRWKKLTKILKSSKILLYFSLNLKNSNFYYFIKVNV